MRPNRGQAQEESFKTVLTLVKAHTILHAHQRKKDEHGRVIATIEDYAVVYDLVADLVSNGTGQNVFETVRETVQTVGHLAAGKYDGVTYREIGKSLGIDESAARRRVKKTAMTKGYLENRETGKDVRQRLCLVSPCLMAKGCYRILKKLWLSSWRRLPTCQLMAIHMKYQVIMIGNQQCQPTSDRLLMLQEA